MRNLLLLILTLLSIHVVAQQGHVRGKIIDATTGEELIGTTVFVEGTTNGTVTDFEGNYSLPLNAGTYTIIVSYISYETQKFENVEVKAGDVTIINVNLGTANVEVEEVVVTARSRQRTETAMLVLQKKSASLIDGISSQQISRMGDGDAAGALKRVTGLSVEGGKYVYVRGLSDRYSKTLLNNAEIPGLDPERNSVQMDLFPSNIIENMMVVKTFSPEFPGDYVGGLVNIITKDFPEKETFQYSSSFSFNPQSNLNDEFLTYEGGKLDWLGFDDGTRDIPDVANADIPARFVDDEKLTEITRSFNKTMEPTTKTSFLNQSHSISYGNQRKHFGKQAGFNIALSYSNNYTYIDNEKTNRYKLIDPADEKLNSQLSLFENLRGENEVLWSALANYNLKFNQANKIGIMIIKNQSGLVNTRYQHGLKNSDEAGMKYETRTLQFKERGFLSTQLKGEHFLKNLKELKIKWLSSFTLSTQDEPDLRFFTNHYYEGENGEKTYEISQSLYPSPTRYYREMSEYNIDNKIDAELPFKFSNKKAKLKFGASNVIKKRELQEKKVFFSENSNSYNGNIDEYLADDNLFSPDGIFVTNSVSSNLKNSYDGYAQIFGTYILADLFVFKDLRAQAGIRYENTYMECYSKKEGEDYGLLENSDILPSLSFTYSIGDNSNIRFASSRTLARPSFRELAPFASQDFVGSEVIVGNPDLKRSIIDNVDLRLESFFKRGEMVSLSLFYKRFNDPIERSFNTEAANPELTWRNVDQAKLMGIEAEIRKTLGFITALKDFKVGGNVTIVNSEVSIDEKELDEKRFFDPNFSDKRVMFGQAPYIVNAYLNYNNDSIKLEANLGFNVTGKKLYLVNAVSIPDIYEQPRPMLDFNIKKGIGKKITIKAKVKNILDSPIKRTYVYKGEEYIYNTYSENRTYSFSFTYLLE